MGGGHLGSDACVHSHIPTYPDTLYLGKTTIATPICRLTQRPCTWVRYLFVPLYSDLPRLPLSGVDCSSNYPPYADLPRGPISGSGASIYPHMPTYTEALYLGRLLYFHSYADLPRCPLSGSDCSSYTHMPNYPDAMFLGHTSPVTLKQANTKR